MNCRSCNKMISAYVDDRLAAGEREAFDAHITECDKCAAELRLARAASMALRTEPAAEPAPDLAARAARAALTAPAEPSRSFLERWIGVAAPTAALAAAAAVLLLVLGGSPNAASAASASDADPIGLVSDADLSDDILAVEEE